MKILGFLSENFQFLVVKFSVYLNRRVFVMSIKTCLWVFIRSQALIRNALLLKNTHNICFHGEIRKIFT